MKGEGSGVRPQPAAMIEIAIALMRAMRVIFKGSSSGSRCRFGPAGPVLPGKDRKDHLPFSLYSTRQSPASQASDNVILLPFIVLILLLLFVKKKNGISSHFLLNLLGSVAN